MSKEEVIVPTPIKQEKEQKLKEKADREELNKKNKDERQLQWEKEKERAKSEEPKKQLMTLFVRNIGFETTEEQFKEFMAQFGDLRYALLCKLNDVNLNDAGEDGKTAKTHKGTGFVQYKDDSIAEELIGLSKSIETKLDEECRTSRLDARKNKTQTQTNKGMISVIQG